LEDLGWILKKEAEMTDPSRGAYCLREACKAAKRRDKNTLDLKLKELSSMNLEIPDTPIEQWIDQVIRDEGLRLGRDLFISKPPSVEEKGGKGFYGLGLQFRF